MSLDIYLTAVRPTCVFEYNITHNLVGMAKEAGIYMHLWRPAELGITKGGELIGPLTDGLAQLKADPDHFKTFNPSNGWGDYGGLVRFVEAYLAACVENSDSIIEANR
jgi:hypothetical protein